MQNEDKKLSENLWSNKIQSPGFQDSGFNPRHQMKKKRAKVIKAEKMKFKNAHNLNANILETEFWIWKRDLKRQAV